MVIATMSMIDGHDFESLSMWCERDFQDWWNAKVGSKRERKADRKVKLKMAQLQQEFEERNHLIPAPDNMSIFEIMYFASLTGRSILRTSISTPFLMHGQTNTWEEYRPPEAGVKVDVAYARLSINNVESNGSQLITGVSVFGFGMDITLPGPKVAAYYIPTLGNEFEPTERILN